MYKTYDFHGSLTRCCTISIRFLRRTPSVVTLSVEFSGDSKEKRTPRQRGNLIVSFLFICSDFFFPSDFYEALFYPRSLFYISSVAKNINSMCVVSIKDKEKRLLSESFDTESVKPPLRFQITLVTRYRSLVSLNPFFLFFIDIYYYPNTIMEVHTLNPRKQQMLLLLRKDLLGK